MLLVEACWIFFSFKLCETCVEQQHVNTTISSSRKVKGDCFWYTHTHVQKENRRSEKVRVRTDPHSCMSSYTALISYGWGEFVRLGTYIFINNMSRTKAKWYQNQHTHRLKRRKFPCDTSTVWCVSGQALVPHVHQNNQQCISLSSVVVSL